MDRRQIPYTGTDEGEASFWRRFILVVIISVLFVVFLIVFA